MPFQATKSIPSSAIGLTKSIITADVVNAKVFKGEVFAFSKRYSIDAEGTLYLVLDPTAISLTNAVLLPITMQAYGGGPLEIDVYSNPTFTDGTVETTSNRNSNITTTPGLVVTSAPTVSAVGTKLPSEFYLFCEEQGAAIKIGGQVSDSLPLVFNKSNTYMFAITNTSTGTANYLQFAFDWLEYK